MERKKTPFSMAQGAYKRFLELYERPEYIIGQLANANPVEALRLLNPLSEIRPEQKVTAGEAMGLTGVAAKAANVPGQLVGMVAAPMAVGKLGKTLERREALPQDRLKNLKRLYAEYTSPASRAATPDEEAPRRLRKRIRWLTKPIRQGKLDMSVLMPEERREVVGETLDRLGPRTGHLRVGRPSKAAAERMIEGLKAEREKFYPKRDIGISSWFRSPENVVPAPWGDWMRRGLTNTMKGTSQMHARAAEAMDAAGATRGSEASKRISLYREGFVTAAELTPLELKAAKKLDRLYNHLGRLLVRNKVIPAYAHNRYLERDPATGKVNPDAPYRYEPHIPTEEIRKLPKNWSHQDIIEMGEHAPASVFTPHALKREAGPGAEYAHDARTAMEYYVPSVLRTMYMQPITRKMRGIYGGIKSRGQAHLSRGLPPNLSHYMREFLMPSVLGRPLKGEQAAASTMNYLGETLGIGAWKNASPYEARRELGKVTAATYHGALGLNLGSAIKNLTQITNTAADIGGEYALKGYKDLASKWGQSLFKRSGVMAEFPTVAYEEMRPQTTSKMRQVTMAPFHKAEWINRGATFLGARRYGLEKLGMTEREALRFAEGRTAQTQFSYGRASLPKVIQGFGGRQVFQFLTFPQKQVEMVGEWVKNGQWSKVARLMGYTGWVVYAGKKAFGADLSNIFGTGIFPQGLAPIPKMAWTAMHGDWDEVARTAWVFLPAGVQARKGLEFVRSMRQNWEVLDRQGRLQYRSSAPEQIKRFIGLPSAERAEDVERIQKLRDWKYKYFVERKAVVNDLLGGNINEATRKLYEWNSTAPIPIILSTQDLQTAAKARRYVTSHTAEERLLGTMPVLSQKRREEE